MEFELIRKCRVCLGDYKQMNHLFKEFDQGITLRDIFINTIGFEIQENDGFSPYVCQNCTTVIVDFYNLKIIYEENENQIKLLLNNSDDKKVENETSELAESSNDVNNANKTGNQANVTDNEDYITIKIEGVGSDSEDSSHENEDTAQENLECNSPSGEINFMHEGKAENYEYQEINTYTCPECGDCFLYENDIHDHMVSKHDITDINCEELSEPSILKLKKHELFSHNKCKICNESYESEESYKQHMETHKKNVCDICGIGFIKKSYLKDHQEIHCTEKRHICNYCNKAFKRRTVLVKHRRIHTHPRQCICEICGKAFNDKGTLKTHIMLLHIRERNYMCLICGVKFPLKGTLEKHIRRHQNKEREFFCTQCPLGYRDKSSLDRHIYVKHSGQNLKSTCDHCGKQYTTVSNLYKHKKNCHKVTEQPATNEQNT